MHERHLPEPTPEHDYRASAWLQFGGDNHVAGDPETEAQFQAAYACLTTLTTHLTLDAGPWFAVTPTEIKEEYRHFLEWSDAFAESQDADQVGPCLTNVSPGQYLRQNWRKNRMSD